LGNHDYEDINDDINRILGVHNEVDLDEPLTAEEELSLLLNAARFFTQTKIIYQELPCVRVVGST